MGRRFWDAVSPGSSAIAFFAAPSLSKSKAQSIVGTNTPASSPRISVQRLAANPCLFSQASSTEDGHSKGYWSHCGLVANSPKWEASGFLVSLHDGAGQDETRIGRKPQRFTARSANSNTCRPSLPIASFSLNDRFNSRYGRGRAMPQFPEFRLFAWKTWI
jgi:hypothetical protein